MKSFILYFKNFSNIHKKSAPYNPKNFFENFYKKIKIFILDFQDITHPQ